MTYNILTIVVYILCFGISMYALDSISFDKICKVSNPSKVTVLLFLLSMGLGYLIAQFILGMTILNW